jgi:hypothetical protein
MLIYPVVREACTAPVAGARARILMKPADFEYAERQYEVADLAGQQWTSSQTLENADPSNWGGTLLRSE